MAVVLSSAPVEIYGILDVWSAIGCSRVLPCLGSPGVCYAQSVA